MKHRLNCWEFKNCGREPGGVLAKTLGVCPVALHMKRDGDNGGRAGGRACWTIPLRDAEGQPLTACIEKACHQCAFFQRVRFEEQPIREGQHHLIMAGDQTRLTQPDTKSIEVA
jgi:hypothetical protein